MEDKAMAFGIDDALTLAATGVKAAETVAEIIEKYRHEKTDYDLEQLLGEVRVTVLARLNAADRALSQFERMLEDKKISSDIKMMDLIAKTPFWRPFEQYRLRQIQKRFEESA